MNRGAPVHLLLLSPLVVEDVPVLTSQLENSVDLVVTRLREKGDAVTATRWAGHRNSGHHEIQPIPPGSEPESFPEILGVGPGRLLYLEPVPTRAAGVDARVVLRHQPFVAALDDPGPMPRARGGRPACEAAAVTACSGPLGSAAKPDRGH
jgi:hypothetical protein